MSDMGDGGERCRAMGNAVLSTSTRLEHSACEVSPIGQMSMLV